MAKDPAFLFYSGDFQTGTQFLTDEQVGMYLRLLMAQHQHGHLTEKQVKMICKSNDIEVMSKFLIDEDNKYYNERLKTEIIKRKLYTQSRSNNKKGKLKNMDLSQSENNKTQESYDNHMDNKNRDKDVLLENIYRSFSHLELSIEEFKKLNAQFTKDAIDNILDAIENHKANTSYTSLYLTALNWLKRAKNSNVENAPKHETKYLSLPND